MKISTEEESEISYVSRIRSDSSDWQHFSKLILFYKENCPFCIRVINYLEKIDKEVQLKNISENPDAKQELLSIGGKTQVPCLLIDGKALYESLDIIRWLSENKESIIQK